MRVLVTGGAGFVGSHAVRQLLDAGHDVVVMDALLPDVHTSEPPEIDVRAEFVVADLRDPDSWRHLLAGVDAVCHQAAMVGLGVDVGDLPAYASANDVGTAVLLAEMARADVRRLVLASSMVIYGEGAYACTEHGPVGAAPRNPRDLDAGRFEPPCPHCGGSLTSLLVSEDAPADPRNAYATSKLAQEHYAKGWARETASRAIALRYHNVFGPGMPRDTPYAGVAAIFRSAIERRQRPQVFEDGGQRRDFIHVSDVAAANVAALEALADGGGGSWQTFNIGSGKPHTVGQMADALCKAAGTGLHPAITGRYRLGDVRHITADSSRARAKLGWTPAVSFEAGMTAFVGEPLRG